MVTPAQDLLLYGCSCGQTFEKKGQFTGHLVAMARKPGEKGKHKSIGRIDPQTSKVVMPPYEQRTKEEKEVSSYALKRKGTADSTGAIRQTDIIMDATQIKWVPRVLTSSFTPIMMAGMMAAQNVWGWRKDMPWENIVDTIFIHFFRDRGIELGVYAIKDPEEHKQVKEQNESLQAETESELKEIEDVG